MLLQADILICGRANRRASGVVLEAKLDKGRGSVATALVQQGTLRVGDPYRRQFSGKVRAMLSDEGICYRGIAGNAVEILDCRRAAGW